MDLKTKAQQIRDELIRVAVKHKQGHIAPSLSCVDILVALHYGVMGLRDTFILSKGHGCYGYYAILSDKGYIPNDFFGMMDLPGCVSQQPALGIQFSTGSLGMGVAYAVGVAWSKKLTYECGNVYCVCGDGELQEGICWEAFQFASHHKLDNLYFIIDRNKLQAMDFVENILGGKGDTLTLYRKLTSFGLYTSVVDYGNDPDNIAQVLNLNHFTDKPVPKALIANTVKGKGLPYMENIPKWHYRVPAEGGEIDASNN